MNGHHVKTYRDNSGRIAKMELKRYINTNELVTDCIVEVGQEFVVKPLNKRKLKHRDRHVKVLSFNISDRDGIRVNVVFLDSKRRGIIPIEDLDTID